VTDTSAEARQAWHTQARERDEAYLAEGPMDMTETSDGPWAWSDIDPDPVRPFNDTIDEGEGGDE